MCHAEGAGRDYGCLELDRPGSIDLVCITSNHHCILLYEIFCIVHFGRME